jgi:hypothetical protein
MAVGSVGSVAVVGAGIAGLACAAALQAGGARVVVFDKARGPGGRMSTRRLDTDRAQTWDHGAQFFTARDPAFAAQVAAWVTAGVVASWAGRVVRWGHAPEPEPSPGGRFVGIPGMSGALASLAAGLDLRLQTRIEQVERVAQGFRLNDDQGNPLGVFEHVALAVPGPQAVPLAQASTGVTAAVASLAYAPCWAVMVAFDSPVAADFDAAFVEERRGSPLGFIARDSTKPGRASGERWVLHAGPAWSAAHLEDPAEAVGPALLEALEQVIGAAVPSVLSLSAHRWRYALPTSLHAARCVHDDGVRLGACGDAFNGARVEGAWLSGRALAEVMLSA